tara:strand:+ start:186 stop:854 length:669 start_codon:yes stop_codon:yes gene_type:complete
MDHLQINQQEPRLEQASENEGILDAYGQKCGRRNFLGLTGAAAAGLMLGSNDAEAGWLGFGYSSKPVAGIPQSWVRLKGSNVNRYANYVKGLRLKNITPRMVLAPHFKTRGNVINDIPPRKMWKKMGPTLKVIDRMAGEMGVPVRHILSAYRSPRYNAAVRGNSGSLHKSNQAVDVVFHGATPWHVARVARYLRDTKRKFKGGIGTYSSFVHIDTRGYKADW